MPLRRLTKSELLFTYDIISYHHVLVMLVIFWVLSHEDIGAMERWRVCSLILSFYRRYVHDVWFICLKLRTNIIFCLIVVYLKSDSVIQTFIKIVILINCIALQPLVILTPSFDIIMTDHATIELTFKHIDFLLNFSSEVLSPRWLRLVMRKLFLFVFLVILR